MEKVKCDVLDGISATGWLAGHDNEPRSCRNWRIASFWPLLCPGKRAKSSSPTVAAPTGESVVVGTVGGWASVTDESGTILLWSGANENPKVTPSMVQGISVTGSPYKDYIDLRQVTSKVFNNTAIQHKGTVTVDCSAPSPPQEYDGDTILLGSFGESATGSPNADTIKCGPDGDTVNGSGGADTITGGAGNDVLTLGGKGEGPFFGLDKALIHGEGGNDTIMGGNMQSSLYGDEGNDTITAGPLLAAGEKPTAGPWGDYTNGGLGSDTLNGGVGVDTITGGGGDGIMNGKGAPLGQKDVLKDSSGNDWGYYNDGVPAYDLGYFPNDYHGCEGNHPEIVDHGENGFEPAAPAILAQGKSVDMGSFFSAYIPDPDLNERITSFNFYQDTVDANGNASPDGKLQQSLPNGKNGDKALPSGTLNIGNLEPGKYTFFAIATASNGYQGNYWIWNVTIEGPKVGINAVVPQTQELLAGQPGVFDVTRDGSTDSPLTVNYSLSGTATNGTDYSTLSGTVTIPAGSADATIDVSPLDDGDGDDSTASESVIATLTSTSGDYDIDPGASSATVNIAEEEPPTVSISADIPTAVESDATEEGEFTISRNGPTDEPLTVNLAPGGTAVAGTNYVGLPASVTIPAGSQTAVLQVAALEDPSDSNGPETVTETIQPGNYTIGSPAAADVSILEQPTSTVTISADVASTMEGSATPGEFTVTRTAPYSDDLTVAYGLSGTAINGVDYQTLSGTVTIPAGAPNVAFEVDPLDDGNDGGEPASSVVTATITPDPNNAYLVGAANHDSVTIAEEAPPQVSIAATTPQISENGSSGTFTVTRTDPTDEPLTVYYTFSGTAQAGTDFTDPGGSVTIPLGAYTSTIPIAPLDDGDGDDTLASETLTATLSSSPTYQIINDSSASMTINEEPIPQVTVVFQSDALENPPAAGVFFVTRTGATDNPLTVTFALGGTAIEGTDYQDIGTTVTIPAGQSFVPINITPIDDHEDEPSESLSITIVNQPGVYAAVSPSSAQLTIEEDGTPTVNVVTGTPTISETGGDGDFTVSRTGPLDQPLTVYYQVDADDLGDFQPLSGQVTVPAGQATTSIDVTPVDDGDADDDMSSSQLGVTLTAAMDGSYNVGPQSSATMTIDEDQPPTVTLLTSIDPTAVEGGHDGYFYVELDRPAPEQIDIDYSVSGTAEPGTDYVALSGDATIPAGALAAAIPVTALEDDSQWDLSDEYVTVTLVDENMGAYIVGTPSSQTINIAEAPVPAVTISADADATEGGADGQFTVTRTAPYDQPLAVDFTVGGSAVAGTDYLAFWGAVTIPAGSNSAVIPVVALADSAGQDDGSTTTVNVNISTPQDSSYTVGDAASATMNILEEPPPVVNFTQGGDANEDGIPAEFTVARSGPTDQPLTVDYTVSGSAGAGIDYEPPSGAVTIPAGSLSAPIYVTPIDDGDGDETQSTETITAALANSSAYAIGAVPSETVNINEEPPPTVSISADADANEDGDVGQFTISRDGPTDDPLTVDYTAAGSAVSGTDYVDIGTSITIPAGESSASIEVTPIDDGDGDDAQASEGVQVTLSPLGAYTVGSDNTATVNVDEESPPTVSLFASISSTDETGSTPGEFTVYRDGSTDSPLTVSYTLSGSAGNSVDYEDISDSVTIPAGDDSATIEITPLDDGSDDPSVLSKDVVATLASSTAYTIDPYSSSDTVTINEDPIVTIAATTPTTEEFGATNGEFTVTRSGPTDEPLDVAYTLGGSAINGTDYTALNGDVLIPAGATTATIDVAPQDDGDIDDGQQSETVVIWLSGGATYDLGGPNSATVTIQEEPVVTIAATTPTTVEDGTTSGEFTVSRGGPSDQPLTVSFTASGTAIGGTDYTAIGTSVTIPAGQTSATIDISPIDDLNDDDNPSETVILTLAAERLQHRRSEFRHRHD